MNLVSHPSDDVDLQDKRIIQLTLVYDNHSPHMMKARAKRCAASMDTKIKVRAMKVVGRVLDVAATCYWHNQLQAASYTP